MKIVDPLTKKMVGTTLKKNKCPKEMTMMILSVWVKRFSVSRMRDFLALHL